MFRTYKSAELELHHLFGPDVQMWHYIELSMHRPWFYAGTRDSGSEDAVVTMRMICDVKVLEALLSEHSETDIDSLQLLSPGYINGTSGWILEDLRELTILGDRSGRSSGYRCLLGGGKCYDVMNLGANPAATHVQKVVFSRY